ncbi:MAG: UDP-N-acetylmuramoyl-L-alanyl-D-glutamate--2,6-diaminopimelate ligase [Anaerolineae bacterium]|nr:UDP-N-acetylmuramoyl-L-alanyl-D-glutamate--2,6-diaminopimelate ligase [Anaerolineae bacterium]
MSRPYSLQHLLDKWQSFAQSFAQSGDFPTPHPFNQSDVRFSRFVEDSRQVTPGDCFVARVRPYSDGHPFIAQAIERGATLVIAEVSAESLSLTIPDTVIYWQVPDTAVTLSWLAAAACDFPGTQMTVIGVTGTDGKTSIANLIYEILVAAGCKTGMISTVKAVIGNHEEPTGLHVTTPQAPEVQALLRRMVDDGVTHCILEATSMGLAEHRVDTAFFDVAVISNITHEHLDYHGDYATYLTAKARLFDLATSAGVINRDDASYSRLMASDLPQLVTYSLDQPEFADISADNIRYSARETQFDLAIDGQSMAVTTPLVGRFNIYNMLAAAGAAHALGIAPEYIKQGLEAVEIISGRMERIDCGQPFIVLVDFAHTPNALAKAIAAARGMTDGRIITVFGSAGRRDVAKRRLMAEYSAELADLTVLTAEDPRGEPLDAILAMMADGCLGRGGVEGTTFWRIPDRGRAIFHALSLAQAGDLVLICGKGHEQSMCFITTEYPWDDREATRTALHAYLAGKPMPDLGLPTFTMTT